MRRNIGTHDDLSKHFYDFRCVCQDCGAMDWRSAMERGEDGILRHRFHPGRDRVALDNGNREQRVDINLAIPDYDSTGTEDLGETLSDVVAFDPDALGL